MRFVFLGSAGRRQGHAGARSCPSASGSRRSRPATRSARPCRRARRSASRRASTWTAASTCPTGSWCRWSRSGCTSPTRARGSSSTGSRGPCRRRARSRRCWGTTPRRSTRCVQFLISDDDRDPPDRRSLHVPGVQAHLPPGVEPAGHPTRPCDVDGAPLEKRDDEDTLTVKRRLAVYRDQTQPLEAFYAERELLRSVDAEAPMADVSERACTRRSATWCEETGHDHPQVARRAGEDAPRRCDPRRDDQPGGRGGRARV